MARKRIGQYTEEDVNKYADGGWRDGWIGRQTPLGLIVKVILALIALSMLTGAIGFASGWFDEGKRIVSPDNVRKTWSAAYQLDNDAKAQARIVCSTAQSEDLAGTVSGSPLLATTSTYQRIWSEYKQLVTNKLEGGLVLPSNLPNRDKTLGQMLTDVGCPENVIDKIPGARLK